MLRSIYIGIITSHSTDTFYGIICTGLTDKTKLSFTSSNSSFNECVSNSHASVHFNSIITPNDPSCFIDRIPATSPACNASSHNTLNDGSKYKFSFCNWNSCGAPGGSGAAITCTGSSTVLIVERCSFISCSADIEGGAIHTSSINTLDVSLSFFHECCTTATMNDHGSGAIWIYGIQQKLTLLENSFISCTSKASGGAFTVWNCLADIEGEDIRESRFLDCNATDTSPDGGAVWIWTNNALIGLSTCLFSVCNSYYGGGLDHYLSNYDSGTYPIRFCFFNKNTGIYGNDVLLYKLSPSNSSPILLHCFSTSDSPRICYNSSGYHNIDSSWLLQVTIESMKLHPPIHLF